MWFRTGARGLHKAGGRAGREGAGGGHDTEDRRHEAHAGVLAELVGAADAQLGEGREARWREDRRAALGGHGGAGRPRARERRRRDGG